MIGGTIWSRKATNREEWKQLEEAYVSQDTLIAEPGNPIIKFSPPLFVMILYILKGAPEVSNVARPAARRGGRGGRAGASREGSNFDGAQ
ncbi:hypothetical protein EVAR_43985_1 [Eumeta japonica]|uniref:Uncharacterized protein n=1 Tax=Eumeta variegata TaxID=151549 RepID=A0A4C1XH30_EUMVA|nr:hypothetical protein EVAR_43985_1 [Eumeta japonica]